MLQTVHSPSSHQKFYTDIVEKLEKNHPVELIELSNLVAASPKTPHETKNLIQLAFKFLDKDFFEHFIEFSKYITQTMSKQSRLYTINFFSHSVTDERAKKLITTLENKIKELFKNKIGTSLGFILTGALFEARIQQTVFNENPGDLNLLDQFIAKAFKRRVKFIKKELEEIERNVYSDERLTKKINYLSTLAKQNLTLIPWVPSLDPVAVIFTRACLAYCQRLTLTTDFDGNNDFTQAMTALVSDLSMLRSPIYEEFTELIIVPMLADYLISQEKPKHPLVVRQADMTTNIVIFYNVVTILIPEDSDSNQFLRNIYTEWLMGPDLKLINHLTLSKPTTHLSVMRNCVRYLAFAVKSLVKVQARPLDPKAIPEITKELNFIHGSALKYVFTLFPKLLDLVNNEPLSYTAEATTLINLYYSLLKILYQFCSDLVEMLRVNEDAFKKSLNNVKGQDKAGQQLKLYEQRAQSLPLSELKEALSKYTLLDDMFIFFYNNKLGLLLPGESSKSFSQFNFVISKNCLKLIEFQQGMEQEKISLQQKIDATAAANLKKEIENKTNKIEKLMRDHKQEVERLRKELAATKKDKTESSSEKKTSTLKTEAQTKKDAEEELNLKNAELAKLHQTIQAQQEENKILRKQWLTSQNDNSKLTEQLSKSPKPSVIEKLEANNEQLRTKLAAAPNSAEFQKLITENQGLKQGNARLNEALESMEEELENLEGDLKDSEVKNKGLEEQLIKAKETPAISSETEKSLKETIRRLCVEKQALETKVQDLSEINQALRTSVNKPIEDLTNLVASRDQEQKAHLMHLHSGITTLLSQSGQSIFYPAPIPVPIPVPVIPISTRTQYLSSSTSTPPPSLPKVVLLQNHEDENIAKSLVEPEEDTMQIKKDI